MSKIADRNELLIEQMRDIYSAEKQLVQALPKMAKAATSDDLKSAFEDHLEATKGHVQRLEEAFKVLGVAARAKHCKGMEGLIEEGKEATETEAEGDIINAALIAAAQRVEHYEIAAYGTVHAMAEQLGNEEVAALFAETLEEEKDADTLLSDIATSEAGGMADEGEDDEDSDVEVEQDEEENAPAVKAKSKR